MKLKIMTAPDPILRQKSRPVAKRASGLKKLAGQMTDLIKNGPEGQRIGVGLSAVQVGKLIRLFVTYNPETKKDLIFINPEIIWKSKKLTNGVPTPLCPANRRGFEGHSSENKYEGCLSAPSVFGLVKRHWTIKVRWLDLDGKNHARKFSGFLATVIQHEIDHLNGILFIDRILKQKGKIYKLEKENNGKEVLVEAKLE